MLKLKYKRTRTPFRKAFTTNHETKTEQESFLVAIEYNGFRGIGEAPIISYYPQTMETMASDLQAKAKLIDEYAFTAPDRFWHFCHHLYPENPFLVCALDLAYWDLYAQIEKKSIAAILDLPEVKTVSTFYTLGQDTFENILADLKGNPWPQYKVKVSDEASVKNLELLRAETDSELMVDANGAWTYEEAKKYIPRLEKANIKFIEQPLDKDDWENMKKLKTEFSIPFYADESFQLEKDIKKCSEAFDGINVKFTKCSGLTPAVRITKEAKELGLQTMLGCMNESEVGIRPALQIASLFDYCDLDGPLLLDKPLQKMSYQAGNIILA